MAAGVLAALAIAGLAQMSTSESGAAFGSGVPVHIGDFLEGRRFRAPMQRALLRVLEGESYRAAAKAENVDHTYVYRTAKSIPDFRDAHLRAWRDSHGEFFPSIWRQHVRRLEPSVPIPQASLEGM